MLRRRIDDQRADLVPEAYLADVTDVAVLVHFSPYLDRGDGRAHVRQHLLQRQYIAGIVHDLARVTEGNGEELLHDPADAGLELLLNDSHGVTDNSANLC